MRKYYFWDVDADCPIEDNFEGTEKDAHAKAIKLARKYHCTVCVFDAYTHVDVATVDEYGDVYL
jgi:hypothetical protein